MMRLDTVAKRGCRSSLLSAPGSPGVARTAALFIVVFVGACFGKTVVGVARGGGAGPISVAATADEVRIRVALDNLEPPLFLVELPIWADSPGDAVGRWPIDAEHKGGFEVALPRLAGHDGHQRDRLLSRWALAAETPDRLALLTPPRYAERVDSVNDAPHPELRNKKGLGGFDVGRGFTSDLDALGISTVTVNVMLDFLRDAPAPGREPFSFWGEPFYVDQARIARLDRTLQAAAERDLLVFAILLTPKPTAAPPLQQQMAHPDYQEPGIFAMPNVTSAAGVRVYAAAVAYLTQRYLDPRGPCGRVHHWIIHNEVDAGLTWTNAGDKPLEEYVALYHKSMRIVHLLARHHDAHSRALASLTHSWNAPESPEFYSGRRVLDHLVRLTHEQGEFDWGVAQHPYPRSLFDAEIWNDTEATHSPDAPFVTFKNIEVLAQWARLEENRHNRQQVRDLYLTEQGFHSADYEGPALETQAAALAYAWKQIADLPEIRAMHYHNWIDNRHEGGLRIGLRRFPDDPRRPGGEKPIWRLYRELGTPNERAACRFAQELIGPELWPPHE